MGTISSATDLRSLMFSFFPILRFFGDQYRETLLLDDHLAVIVLSDLLRCMERLSTGSGPLMVGALCTC